MRKTALYPAFFVLLLMIWLLAYRVDVKLNRIAPVKVAGWKESSTLFRGEALKVVSMGYDTAIADYFFMKMIQYFAYQGDNRLPMNNITQFIGAISELDPKFVYSYEFAWNVLVNYDTRPDEVKIREGGEILRKGWRNNTDSWLIAQDLGFHNFFYEGNFEQAANMYDVAFRLRPSFPLYAQLASRMRSEAGKPELARLALEQQMNITRDPETRALLEKQIQLVNVEITARRLEEYVETFRKDKGHLPDSLSELVGAGYLPYLPEDGLGGTFKWDTEKQEVVSNSTPRLRTYFSAAYIPPWKK